MRAIIFDLGNVVCFFDHRKALGRLSRFTTMTPEEMYAAMYDSPMYDQLERGQIPVPSFLRYAQQLWQVRCDTEFLSHAISDIFTLNPEVSELLPKLRERYRIVLGSNTNAIHARQFLKQFPKVLRQFHALGLSHEMGTRKPDADFYHACLHMAQVKASDCVFIDDLPANIEGAQAVGMQGIVYRPNEGLREKLLALGVALEPPLAA